VIKDFAGWNDLKIQLNSLAEVPGFQEREIWWCCLGINIGHEMDGKNRLYSRPVLVLRKFNKHVFLGLPLTTKIKSNPYYYPIHFKERDQCVMLSQLRLWESKRLTTRMGRLSSPQFEQVKEATKNML
jgi:mRNA interferase MazF